MPLAQRIADTLARMLGLPSTRGNDIKSGFYPSNRAGQQPHGGVNDLRELVQVVAEDPRASR